MLEWSSFGLILLSTLLYGRSKYWGAVVGILGSISFLVFGFVADLNAAIACNLVFIVLHWRNFHIARGETNV